MRNQNNNIKYLNCLGKGKFGEVYLTAMQGSNKYYATKFLKKEQMDKPEIIKYLLNERDILKQLHPI